MLKVPREEFIIPLYRDYTYLESPSSPLARRRPFRARTVILSFMSPLGWIRAITSFEILDSTINLKAFGEYTTVSVKLTRKFVRSDLPIKVENPHIHRYGINCFPLRKEYL